MATLLESYVTMKASFDAGTQNTPPDASAVLRQQELLYRIEVLEVCQIYVKTAPHSANPKDLYWHYQMVDAFVQNLTLERRYGISADDSLQKQRETAHGNLLQVVQDYHRRFGSFNTGNDADCYSKMIIGVIQTVILVWIQYRQTYVDIKKEAVS